MFIPNDVDFFEKLSNSLMKYKSKTISFDRILKIYNSFQVSCSEEELIKDFLDKKIIYSWKKGYYLNKNINKYSVIYPFLIEKLPLLQKG